MAFGQLFPKEGEKQIKIRHCRRMIADSLQKDYGINGSSPEGPLQLFRFLFAG